MINEEIRHFARKIWDYSFIRQPLKKSDCIMVLCSHDIRIAEYATKLFLEGWASTLLFSGGQSELTSKIFNKPEADLFSDLAIKAGVPSKNILIENKSTNTGENLANINALLENLGRHFDSFILVQKPNMLRRVLATALKQWPNKEMIVSSHDIPFESAPHHHVNEEMFIHEIVGDLQRIKIYPQLGFQVYQDIPDDVWSAYEALIAHGFTKYLVN